MSGSDFAAGALVFIIHTSGPLLLLAGVCYANLHLSVAGAAAWIVSAIYQVAYVIDRRNKP